MRRLIGRGWRPELVAGLGFALALPALALPAGSTGVPSDRSSSLGWNTGVPSDRSSSLGWNSQSVATETTLATQTRDQAGRTQATLTVTVAGQDGLPAAGAVVIENQGKPLAGVALDAHGHATSVLDLPGGDYSLTAVYAGDAAHQGSVSQLSPVRAVSGTTPDFGITVAPATLSLSAGQSGSVTAFVAPMNAASLTAPMFVTLSCSGLPDQSSCTFTPENVEILPGATAAVTSSIVVATASGSSARAFPPAMRSSNPVAWAVLLPGVLGLAGLAFGVRRNSLLRRFSLLALVGLVSVLGATACSPLYNYHNHGPPHNLPTPAGNYTVIITAQSSNGITATTHSISMVLTVK